MADIRTVEKYSRLESERSALKDKLARVEDEIKKLREPVLDYFQHHGIQHHSCHGRTLYLRRELWAGKLDEKTAPEDCVRILHATGFDDLAPNKVSWNTLSALFREREKNGDEAVPEALRGHFVASESFKIGSRKS